MAAAFAAIGEGGGVGGVGGGGLGGGARLRISPPSMMNAPPAPVRAVGLAVLFTENPGAPMIRSPNGSASAVVAWPVRVRRVGAEAPKNFGGAGPAAGEVV